MTTNMLTVAENIEQTSLYKLFESAALSHAHSIATIFDDGDTVAMITYSDVLKSSLMIANVLWDIGWKNQSVGVYCGASQHIPAVLLGILQASCFFVPLDHMAPVHINTHVISATALQIVLVQASQFTSFVDTVGKEFQIEICCIDKLEDIDFVVLRIHQERTKDISSSELGLAYVMLTSGTTGLPKVIRVPHKCIVPNILHLRETFGISEKDVIFNAATLTFDTSVVEIFMALSQGASLLMVPSAVKLMPRRLMGILMRNHVTLIQATPTLIQRFDVGLLRTHLFGPNSTLCNMIFGGESCPTPAMIHQWCSKDNKTAFYNIYGITEVSCWASFYRIPDEDIQHGINQSVPIGDPLRDTILQVADDQGNPVSCGHGTVFIGGLKRVCYLDEEEMSPAPEPVMRNTGDLVEVTERGLIYLGRHDDQVKRHGKRITLTQIQQSVQMISTVCSCAAVLDGKQLLLFCVPTNKQISPIPQRIAPTDTFLSELKDVLPSHGLPDGVFWVSNLPLTLHGKLDRCGLLQVADEVKATGDTIVNEIGVKKKIHQLWKVALPQGTIINNDSNFLHLGGDSFQAVHMATAVEMWCRTPLPDFVDKLLHRRFQDIVLYVEDILSKHTCTSTLRENSGTKQSLEHRKMLKRPLAEAKQRTSCEYSLESNKVRKHDNIVMPASAKILQACKKCAICNVVLTSDSTVCQKQKCLKSLTKPFVNDNQQSSHNLPHPVQPDQCAGNNYQSTTLQDKLDEAIAPDAPYTCWQYSLRRGSQATLSNRQDCLVDESDDISENPMESRDADRKSLAIVERWKYNTGKCVDASPLIVKWRSGCVVYIGSHSHKFAAISMETGMPIWESVLGDRVESSACLSTCGKFVVVGCYDNHVYFLNSTSGCVYWKFKTNEAVKSSPVADSESSLVYIGSHDQCLYALNAEDKTCYWRIHCGGGSVFSSPCVYYPTQTIYVGTLSGDLLAVCKKRGRLHWRYMCPKPIFSSPVASVTGVIVGCADGVLYSVSHTGDKLWTFQTEAPIFSSPCIFSDDHPFMSTQTPDSRVNTSYVVFGSHDHYVYCLDKITGKQNWRMKLQSQVYSTPFIFQSEKQEETLNLNKTQPIRKCVRLSAEIDQPVGRNVRKDDNIDIAAADPESFDSETTKRYQQSEESKYCVTNIPDRIENKKLRHQSDSQESETNPCVTVSCTDGVVVILDGSTGTALVSYKLPGEVFSSPVVHGNQIIVGCRNDFVYCLDIRQTV